MKIINADTLDAILKNLLRGMDLQTAVVSTGYNVRLFMRHLEKGAIAYNRESEGLKVRASEREEHFLYISVMKARAQAAQALISDIRAAEDWKAKKWLLESQHQETYGAYNIEGVPHAPTLGGDE